MANKNLGPQIKALRAEEGLSYRQIQDRLGCSRSTISYHLGVDQKAKSLDRQKALRRTIEGALGHKISHFQGETPTKEPKARAEKPESVRKAQRRKVRNFAQTPEREFDWEDVVQKVGEAPSCYLTGDPVDLADTRSYELDHIQPRSRGGNNSLGNLGVATREANRAKGALALDDFVTLCRKVVAHYDAAQID